MPSRVFYTSPGPSPWFSYMGDVPMPHLNIDHGFAGFGYAFNKGYTPPPVTVQNHADGNGLRLVFDSDTFTDAGCVCNINCEGAVLTGLPTGGEGETTVCPSTDGYNIDINIETTTADPVVINIDYTDSQGNQSSIEINSIYAISPQVLSYWVSNESGVDFIEVGPTFTTTEGTSIRSDISNWQVQRYVGSSNNTQVCVDWQPVEQLTSPVHILDRTSDIARISLTSGNTYGFRVRYRSLYGEVSPWSDWITVTV